MRLTELFDGKGQRYDMERDCVLYAPQTLDEEQKEQARKNIGATAINVSIKDGVLSIE